MAVILRIISQQKSNKPLKPVERSEVERKKFLDRMSFNDSRFKWLKREGKKVFQIEKLQASTYKETKVFEMVLKRVYFNILPFGRSEGYVFKADSIEYDASDQKSLSLLRDVSAWLRLGIYIDNSFNANEIKFFNRDYAAQTDFEDLSSVYYATAQEQSVINPDRGHSTLTDHLEIEKIKEQRRKNQLQA